MNKDPKASFQQEANDSAEVSKRKTTLIAMLNDIKSNISNFDSSENITTNSISDEDYEILILVLSDAIQGEDIAVQYPLFYKRLLADSLLRKTFLDMLNALNIEGQHISVDLPINDPDLSFLDNPRT